MCRFPGSDGHSPVTGASRAAARGGPSACRRSGPLRPSQRRRHVRRGAAARWATDPTGGGPALRSLFEAAVIAERGAEAGRALSLAEDRLADQRNRSPSMAERYAELLLWIQRSRRPETSDRARDVSLLAAGVAGRLRVDATER